MKYEQYDAVVVGGGFFGCCLAVRLRGQGARVIVVEREHDFLQRASYNNQARIHHGYHYPRHFLTAVRSRVNFPRFVQDFRGCVVDTFEKYYAIATRFSKTTARQFCMFMDRAGAPVRVAPPDVVRAFNPQLIENVFVVEEYAFDAVLLKQEVLRRMESSGVEWMLDTTAETITSVASGGLRLDWCQRGGASGSIASPNIYNCTYSNLNYLLTKAKLQPLALKHEITEMCLVEPPSEFRSRSVTIMCGPFFSLMPFPPSGLYTLSHVRYTPHAYWYDDDHGMPSPYDVLAGYPRKTAFPAMIRDVARYVPVLAGCQYQGSLWEVKTTLPASEWDDGRPILFKPDYGFKGVTCIMGGKIDNIYDVYDEVDAFLAGGGKS